MEKSFAINDNERTELNALREENGLLKLENEQLRKENENLKNLSVQDVQKGQKVKKLQQVQQEDAKSPQVQLPKPERTSKMMQLEKEIEERKTSAKEHRLGAEGKCWYFGIKGLQVDYGEVWDSASYWWLLINSNPVNESFCLHRMGFLLLPGACTDCSKNIEGTDSLFSQWKSLLR